MVEPQIPAVPNTERYLDLRAVCEITGLFASTLKPIAQRQATARPCVAFPPSCCGGLHLLSTPGCSHALLEGPHDPESLTSNFQPGCIGDPMAARLARAEILLSPPHSWQCDGGKGSAA